MQSYTIANIGSMLAVLVGLVNVFTFREMWILFAVISVLIILAIYTVRDLSLGKDKQEIENHISSIM